MALESIMVQRDGPRGWHRIDKDKYDANPSAYVVCDENGKPVGPDADDAAQADRADEKAAKKELASLRAAYSDKFGKKPFGGWDAKTLRAKISE